jgi:hypothetical protein
MFGRRLNTAIFFRLVFVGVGISAAAACGGGSVNYTPIQPRVPQSVTTSVPLSISTSGPAIAAAPLPAPSGYTSQLTVPIVSAPAGTTVQFVSSVTLPASLPALQSLSRVASSVRGPQSAGNLTPIFFDSMVPSASVTIAGDIVESQVFPSGTLSAGTAYYLGFYDSTQPGAVWQTIDGPVTTSDGVTLTFGGRIKSFTLQAGKVYGFAIFALASVAATPPPAPQLIAYVGQGSAGITEYTESGTLVKTLPITAGDFGLDDSGTLYALVQPTASPNASPSASPPPAMLAKFPAGSASPIATYQPSNPTLYFASASGAGEIALVTATSSVAPGGGTSSENIDVWNPGIVGRPSYSILASVSGLAGFVGHDGSLYVQSITAGGLSEINVYPPGSPNPSRTIPERLVPAGEQSTFYANYAAVGPDGTIYVTEYTFVQPDPLAGLYIYHPDGTESFALTTGATGGTPGSVTGAPGPEGVDVDAAGNIYVSNANGGFYPPSYNPMPDTLNDVEVFAPGGTSVLRHITGIASPITTAVASDGTAFVAGFQAFIPNQPQGTYVIPAGATTARELNSTAAGVIVLYDGNRETTGIRRGAQSVAWGAMHGVSGSLQARVAALIARRRP